MLKELEGDLGILIIKYLQSGILGEILWYLLLPFNYIGSELGYIIGLPVIYWCFNKKVGIKLILLSVLCPFFIDYLKDLWMRPRPFHMDSINIKHIANTLKGGLPSGHTAFGTILGLGIITCFSKKAIKYGILFIVLMALSRLVHGMHFLQDVVLGFLIGIIMFYSYDIIENKLRILAKTLSRAQKYKIITISILLILIAVFQFSKSHNSALENISIFGSILGFLIGVVLESKNKMFNDSKVLKINVKRHMLGLLGLILTYLTTKVIISVLNFNIDLVLQILYLIKYMLIGLWVTYGAPLVFKKLKIN